MKIKTKLIVMASIPILSMLYFAIVKSNDTYNVYNEMKQIKALSELAVKSSNMVHELQKERGKSAGFLGSSGKKFISDISGGSQYKLTDDRVSELKYFLQDFDREKCSEQFRDHLKNALADLAKLSSIRKKVTTLSIPVKDEVAYYTNTNHKFLALVADIAEISTDTAMAKSFVAYYNFLESKERSGIERAVLSNTFAKNKFAPGLYAKFTSLILAQKLYLEEFLLLASKSEKDFYQEKKRTKISLSVFGKTTISPFAEVKKLRAVALAKGNGGLSKVLLLSEIQDSIHSSNPKINDLLDDYQKFKLLDKEKDALKQLQTHLLSNGSIMDAKNRKLISILRTEAVGNFGIDSESWFKVITAKINLLKDVENQLSSTLIQTADTKESDAFVSLLVITIFTGIVLIISIALTALFSTMIVNSINHIIYILHDIAEGEGDLTKKLTSESNDETKDLAKWFNIFVKKLNDILIKIRESSNQVSIASSEVSGASQSLSQGATEQAASLEEISSSMTEVNSQIKTNAENATQASKLSTSARSAAKNGAAQMEVMVNAMQDINDSSQHIANIIKVIDDIAFQTNLLALNAAVEAARAGRHGKGFAVVADEVRNLAGRSAKAAHETAELIDSSVNKVKNGMNIAKNTSESFEGIVSSIVKVTDLVSEIATASNEQAEGVSQINAGLEQLDSVTQQSTASSEETAATSEELSGQAKTLIAILAQFKLDESNDSQRQLK